MNPIIQIFTIAEYEGYKDAKFLDQVPDYLKNLNAMHKVEKTLFNTHQSMGVSVYYHKLVDMCSNNPALAIQATAAQRAEAFLKTIGKWEE